MDPQTALSLSVDPNLTPYERSLARRDLAAWLARGGFTPSPRSQAEVRVLRAIRSES